VPLHAGGGSRLKVLQAMAAGVPLVSTSNGMLGIDARPGEHYLRADEAAGFAAAIRDVLADRGAAEARAAAARSLVSGAYGLEAVGIRWRAAIDAVTSAGG
jgi:glycosyltransferase involved in cell wall biosynthesis